MKIASENSSVPLSRTRAGDGLLRGTMRCLRIALAVAGLAAPLIAQQGAQDTNRVIQNQTEFNAFTSASNLPDPASRAEALDAFVKRYPHSVALVDALEEEMAAWEQAGDMDKVAKTAGQLVAAEPGNIRSLAVLVALNRSKAMKGDQVALDDLCMKTPNGAQQLSSWQKPRGMTDAEFTNLRNQMQVIFVGAEGYCALQERRFAVAHDFYAQVLKMDPNNWENVYQMGVTDLEMDPPDLDGFWYCAKSVQLAQIANNMDGMRATTEYCMTKYARYHGSGEGWAAILKAAEAQDEPPRNFAKHIKRGREHKSKHK